MKAPRVSAVATSEILGCMAFKAGKRCAPAADKDFMNFAASLNGAPMGSLIPALEAWHRGWANANLAAAYAAAPSTEDVENTL